MKKITFPFTKILNPLFIVKFSLAAILLLLMIGHASAQTSGTNPPELIDFSFTPSVIDTTYSPQNVTITVHAKDANGGFRDSSVSFYRGGDTAPATYLDSSNRISGDDTDGVYRQVLTFSANNPTGMYRVSVSLSDRLGNFSIFNAAELAERGFASQLQITQQLPELVFAATGNLDSTFGTNGVANVFINGTEMASDLFIQPDGKIIVVGVNNKSGSNGDFSLSRSNPDGSLDVGFGIGGKVLTSFSDSKSGGFPLSAALQNDGKIVLAGTYRADPVSYVALARYNPDGSLDKSFGSDGKVIAESVAWFGVIYDIALQTDGKIIVAGKTGGSDFTVVRFNTNGTADRTFDRIGRVDTSFGTGGGQAHTVGVQPDGKIIVGGYTFVSPANIGFALVRYNPNGSLDTTFGNGGKTIIKISSSQSQDVIFSLAVQPDGKIVAVGASSGVGSPGTNSALARFNPDGSLDASFGVGGKVITPLSDQKRDLLTDVVLQSDGKLMVSGYIETGGIYIDIVVGRYNQDGTPDSSFGIGGFAPAALSGDGYAFVAIALQADGKAVAAGTRAGGFIVTRYPVNGFRNFNFDGDAKSDISVFRPTGGIWYMQQSTSGFSATAFGQTGDKLVPADYDGDDKTDIAVYRNGAWYLLRSTGGYTAIQFGAVEDIPQPADYDGDGRAELAVFRPSDGTWYTLNLVANQFNAVKFGISTDKPVVGDYDGDGRADYAVFRPETGTWYLLRSQAGFIGLQFGIVTDKLLPADYDGDGKTDIAVYREGIWYLLRSRQGFIGFQFGIATDVPMAADFDGDGKTDIAVYRDNTWYLQQSTQGFAAIQFGAGGDQPIPNAFVP